MTIFYLSFNWAFEGNSNSFYYMEDYISLLCIIYLSVKFNYLHNITLITDINKIDNIND